MAEGRCKVCGKTFVAKKKLEFGSNGYTQKYMAAGCAVGYWFAGIGVLPAGLAGMALGAVVDLADSSISIDKDICDGCLREIDPKKMEAVDKKVVGALADIAVENVKTTGLFAIPNVGKIVADDVARGPSRRVRNPATGDMITVPGKPAAKPLPASQVATRLAQVLGIDRKQASAGLKGLAQGIAKSLEDGRDVKLRGIGTLGVQHRKARSGKNPMTGKVIKISAARFVRMKIYDSFRKKTGRKKLSFVPSETL